MDEAERDYAEAQRRIAACEGEELDLSKLENLKTLPPELTGKAGLQRLNLNRCKSLTALPELSALTGLQQLDLSGCFSLTALLELSALTGLQQLNLSGCFSLTALLELSALTGLQQLNLSACILLTDLTALSALTGLQQLDLSECYSLTDLTALSALTGLQQLNLRMRYSLTDLTALSALTGLQQLNLSWCDSLTDLTALSALTGLQRLDLSKCKSLTDLTALSALTGLQQLRLVECGSLTDLPDLSALTGLVSLNLYECPAIIDCHPDRRPLKHWQHLKNLIVPNIASAPSELASQNFYDNALPRIRAWQTDLLAGEAPQSTVKLFVLGNGGVGKTQLCRRLLGRDFDASVPSTHGIITDEVVLAAATPSQPEIRASLWDFGGQDVYLGTHALFLDERAIYVIAWTPAHENCAEFEQNGVPMRNRPLRYWLEYVRSLAGPQAPVIVVQTQCDKTGDKTDAPLPEDAGFEYLETTRCSARVDGGMERLQLELKNAARLQFERYGKVCLPARWVAVMGDLRARRVERTLPLAEFEQLCRYRHGTTAPRAVLEYLHRSGQVFWKPEAFDGKVVLDLAWVMEGIYAVLERGTVLPAIRRSGGRFSLKLLRALIWQGRSEADCELFVEMMERCNACFEISDGNYIAPALMPDQLASEPRIKSLWQSRAADAVVRLEYEFLHEGTLRAVLCGIGEQAGEYAVYWSYGVCFYDAERDVTVKISSHLPSIEKGESGGAVLIEVAGGRASEFAKELVWSIERYGIGKAPVVSWARGSPEVSQQGNQLDEENPAQAFVTIHPAVPPLANNQPLPVYVSYALRGASASLVEEFRCKLSPDEFEMRRDLDVNRPGDWISKFMHEIAQARDVLVVLSEEYLQSYYCMFELLHLYRSSGNARERLMEKIITVHRDDLNIATATARNVYVRHWRQRHDELEKEAAELGVACFGQAARDELLLIKDFMHHTGDILHWVSDTVMPRSSAGIDAAIELLRQRAAQHRGH